MQTDKFTEIITEEWCQKPISSIYPQLKALRRELFSLSAVKNGFPEKRLIEKELGILMKAHKGFFINTFSSSKSTDIPSLGALLATLREISLENVINCVSRVMAVKTLSSMDIDSIVWQTKFAVIRTAILDGSDNLCGEKLAMLTEINEAELCRALNPLEMLYSGDGLYNSMTDETRMLYRKMTAEIAIATGIEESKLSREYMARREKNAGDIPKSSLSAIVSGTEAFEIVESDVQFTWHIGEVIIKDYRRVFPFINIKHYLYALFITGILLSVSVSFFSVWWAFLIAFIPVLAIIKPVIDFIAAKSTHVTGVVPSVDLAGKVPSYAKTLCTISTLLTDKKDVIKGLEKLKSAKLRNNSKNIMFALLCDLKASESEKSDNDEAIINMANKVFGDRKDFIILIRNREWCKTQGLWQGKERKRGAVLALAKLLRNKGNLSEQNKNFCAVYGDNNALENIKYICALDYDTSPLMDSISELVGVAVHPLNKNKGIIAPRITTTLSSYLKTGFSRAMSGNGGCAGASTYDSFSGEMYQDCFGEGIFTGKGLIDVDIFLSHLDNENSDRRFPDEKILSHDIIEGGCTGVCFAGNVEFSDNFPDTSNAYFKRQHRWLRGDLQNFRYIFDAGFSVLTRWKLADNVRRAVTPLFIFICIITAVFLQSPLLTLTALSAISMPFLMGFVPSVIKGRHFANYRRFYSPVISQTKQLLRQLVLEIMLTPKNALVSFDALARTVWRTLVTKKHLLDWSTSAAFENLKLNFIHIVGAELCSLILLIFAGINGDYLTLTLSFIFMAALPVLIFIDRTSGETAQKIPLLVENEIKASVNKMWSFYNDFVTAEHHCLPPDNVQYSPVFRVAARTSPTNIGMYLLSVLCAHALGFIEKSELESRVRHTIATVQNLEKWHGNLMNWYDTKSLNVISPFVSSVDSGNFVCCLIALKEGLKHYRCDGVLILRIEHLIEDTNLKPFYNKARNLFSIGYDMEKNELSRHNYDLIMSESRMMSYYAVATGQADKKHWRSLGRVMGKSGRYAAPVSWTGTMFEYFMPELLLRSKEGSMEYEALRFSLHCQQKRGRETGLPFGISESGYFAFDEALNYQYKAHGVQEIGLKAGLNKERVISPYSSFLSLAYDPLGSYNNLVKLEKLGACHSKYGFYEAVDFTKHRVGTGHAIVKSHMAHHVGMSVVGATNALLGGIVQNLFLSDENMKRADELLEEKIIAGEIVLGSPERQEEEFVRMNAIEITKFSLDAVQINPLSNGALTVLCSDIGLAESYYNRKNMIYSTCDLHHPRGSVYALAEGEHVMPFFNHPSLEREANEAEQSVLFMQNSTEYYRVFRNLNMGMQVFLHPDKPVEIRKFAVENESGVKRQLTLAAYIEPALAKFRHISAHPAFMDLFLKVRYDDENKLIIASRKERQSENETVMAVGFKDDEDFTFSLNRENTVSRNGGIFSALLRAKERNIDQTTIPSPCVFIKADFPLDAHGKRECELFFCYGESCDEVIRLAKSIRLNNDALKPSEEIISPLVADTIYGRLTRRILPHILYAPKINEEAVGNNIHDIKGLWRFGISGDLPIVVYEFFDKVIGIDSVIEMKKALSLCQIDFDLVIIYENEAQKQLIEQLKSEINTELFCVGKNNTEADILELIRACAVFSLRSDELLLEPEKAVPAVFLPVLQSKGFLPDEFITNDEENYFHNESFVITKSTQTPWSHVLANSQFGTLVSDRALGFSWALNSRENKLTPWLNDLRADNKGEMLLLKTSSAFYDIIDGSNAVFAPNKADYFSTVKGINLCTSVRIFSRGMGKEITVEFENNAKKAQTVYLAYYTEPVLGVDRNNARFIKPQAYKNNGSLVFRNPSNGTLSGAMIVSSDRECEFLTCRNDFWTGNWNNAEHGESFIKPAYDLIGAVIVKLELPPKHKDKVKFILAFTLNSEDPVSMKDALEKLDYMPEFCSKNEIHSGDKRLDALYKHWLPWQTIGARMWARTGFYQNSGAYGYRDQLQDCLCCVEVKPVIAKRQILRACTVQFQEGDVLHWWHDLLTVKKGVRSRYSDDLLWLPYVLAQYVASTGDHKILETGVYYSDGEKLAENEHEKYIEVITSSLKESVYSHAKRALDKAYKKGQHELLLMGSGDWCDGYNNVGLGGKGESVWLSMFYIMTARDIIPLAQFSGDEHYSEKLFKRISELKQAIEQNAWDGEYYLRAFYDDMRPMGSTANEQCRIDLLPQAFSVLSELDDDKRKIQALNSAVEQLCDRHYKLIKLFNPPFKKGKTWQNPGYVMSYPEGVRENGGQYTQVYCP